MAWTIKYTETAKRQLKKLDRSVARRILDYMDTRVAADPRAHGKPLSGKLGELWRYRVGNARVLCEIQDKELVALVVTVGHRKDIYR